MNTFSRTKDRQPMVAMGKILRHRERIAAYLAGSPVFPVTLELGLTTACNRYCRHCPSRLGPAGIFLSPSLVKRLFAALQGNTPGLIVTGGEPTLHPEFGTILAAARKHGFTEVAVISNGSMLDRESIWRPLLEWASVVRVSLYDGKGKKADGLDAVLRRIHALRLRIEAEASHLQVGVSLLTGHASAGRLGRIAGQARDAGAHWIYFHPSCIGEAKGEGRSIEKKSDLPRWPHEIETENFAVHFLEERFDSRPIYFRSYHGAHFILVVAADGKNYLSSEVKYQSHYEIAQLAGGVDSDFLRKPERLERIASVHSRNYPAIRSRSRGVLYSHLLEKLKRTGLSDLPGPEYLFPNII